MPHVLAHVGVQTPLTRRLIRDADPRWIYLGLLIPDLPWIVQRAIWGLGIPVDHALLRLYVTAQASLILSLVLAGAFSLLADRARVVFVILSLNAFLHLLLDAVERKWGDGVHLIAPLDWDAWNLGWIWPENPWISLLGLLGLGFVLWHVLRDRLPRLRLGSWAKVRRRSPYILILGALYVLLPFLWLPAMWEADTGYVRTMAEREERSGRFLELDREPFAADDAGGRVLLLREEWVDLRPSPDPEAKLISVQGTFETADKIRASRVHVHPAGFRDLFSYVGLLAILLVWLGLPDRIARSHHAALDVLRWPAWRDRRGPPPT